MTNFVFDFDGTLIDSRTIMFNALNDLGQFLGFYNSLDEDIEFSYPEYLLSTIFKKYKLNDYNYGSCTMLYREYLKKYESKKMTFLNLERTLSQLRIRQKNLFIISDRKTVDLEQLLSINLINEYFIEYIGRDLYGLKAKNKSLTCLMNKYDMNPKDTIYIGDKVSDFKFALDNKINFARAAYSNEPFYCDNCDYFLLKSIGDLLKI